MAFMNSWFVITRQKNQPKGEKRKERKEGRKEGRKEEKKKRRKEEKKKKRRKTKTNHPKCSRELAKAEQLVALRLHRMV